MRRGLLATRQELTHLADHIGRHPYNAIHDMLRKRCAMILESRPVNESEWRLQHGQGRWGAALTAARTCQGRIFDLIVSHHIDPNTAYRDRAIEEMKSLASWGTWTDPCHAGLKADLCTGECCATMAIALDWLEEDLAEVDRLRCVHALREKGLNCYSAAVSAGAWWHSCYHNWNAVVNAGCGLAALALSDDDPRAANALAKAREGLTHFFNALGREGGWDEGIGYWAYAMRYVLLFGEALDRQLDDRSVFRQRGMDATGTFPVYFSPRGQSASFGDASGVPLYGVLYDLARRYGAKEVCWWLDRHALHRDTSTSGWSDVGLSLLLRPIDMECEPAPRLAPVKIFNEIGWAALCDHWPEPNLYVSIKGGDLSANHSQLDMNSIQLQVDGEMLLTDPGNPPFSQEYLSADRFKFYEAQARAHNTLVAGEREHRIDARGQILEAQETPDCRWVASNAGAALGDNVRFNRHVVMLVDPATHQGHTVVVVDELHNALSEKVQAYWHSFGRLALEGEAGKFIGRQSELHFRLAGSSPIACDAQTRTAGQLTESTLVATVAPVQKLILVTVFSRRSVGRITMKQSSRGDVSLRLGLPAAGHRGGPQSVAQLHFKGSRRHLQLDSATMK